MDSDSALVVFQGKNIRRLWHNDEWYFSVIDIIEVLTESPKPRQYWGKIKDREFKQLELSPIWIQLKLRSSDSKDYMTDCANTKSLFRIIQSIPSKDAIKNWMGSRNTIEFLVLRENLNNPDFKGAEFDSFKQQPAPIFLL
ncbi:MAG: BRO family protein [archaeon]